MRSSHLVGDRCLELEIIAVAAACSLCHDQVFPSCSNCGSDPRAQSAREHRWRHMWHMLFECQVVPGLDSSVALTLLRDDLLRVCSGSDHVEAVSLAAFPSSRIPIATTTCVGPSLLNPPKCPAPYVPMAHEIAVFGSCRSVPAWCVLRGVHPPAPKRFCVGTLPLAYMVRHPCVVALPTGRVQFCPVALACAWSCFAHIRPCAQGRNGRYAPRLGVVSDLFLFFQVITVIEHENVNLDLLDAYAHMHNVFNVCDVRPSLHDGTSEIDVSYPALKPQSKYNLLVQGLERKRAAGRAPSRLSSLLDITSEYLVVMHDGSLDWLHQNRQQEPGEG